ncbi:cytochrome P450 [Rhizobium sp. NZLR1]|uniref:cytochrome P450 n=1 Tax=Rhizobium sp. NZLR1 TaxID=2731096 RepID=UPI001A98C64D|nr:cytochrome P450 [Rhizobium sp. NZLR1]MBX5204043.1 cytochrome P450 [Rhizobium sp. NZLR1]QSZ25158.1 cytochrome P450 [Rhizobium sp. NZLR1]
MSSLDELPFINVTASEHYTADPVATLNAARKVSPIIRSDRGIEILSHRLGQMVLRDRRLGADHLRLVEHIGIPEGPVLDFKRRMLLGQEHNERRTRIRRIMVRYFGAGQVAAMRATVRRLVDELLDDIGPTPAADILGKLCMILPARLYCEWIGAPKQDAPFVSRLSDQVLEIFNHNPGSTASIVSGYSELFPYVAERIAYGRGHPGDNILSALISDHANGELSDDELFDFVTMLLEASTDNTANQLALTLALVIGSPGAWEGVKSDATLIPTAVQESVRMCSRTITNQRYGAEDFEIDGVTVPNGTAINVVVWAAHNDPAAFMHPDVFDIHRRDVSRTLTFGGGAFSCLGQHIAEIEIQETISAIATRFPNASVSSFRKEHNPFAATALELKLDLRR